jgi:hypothetical protein
LKLYLSHAVCFNKDEQVPVKKLQNEADEQIKDENGELKTGQRFKFKSKKCKAIKCEIFYVWILGHRQLEQINDSNKSKRGFETVN